MDKTVIALSVLTAALIFGVVHYWPEPAPAEPSASRSTPAGQDNTQVPIAVDEDTGQSANVEVADTNATATETTGSGSVRSASTASAPAVQDAESPVTNIDSLSRQFSRDPAGMVALLSDLIEKELEEAPEDADAAMSVVSTINAATSNGTIKQAIVEAMRGVRCSRNRCELLFELAALESRASELAMISHALRAGGDEFPLALHAHHPTEENLWTLFLVRGTDKTSASSQ